jgi:hypothetical protein
MFQHVIPLKEGSKPIKKKLRMMNPKLNPLVKMELEKLKNVGIIFSIRHSEWLLNHVVVRKKNGEIHLCVYLRDLNRASIKDNYPFPNMKMFQQVIGSALMSMLGGFSGYNQILVVEKDQRNIVFITPWGMYTYVLMSLELKNAGATFQRTMDHAFKNLIEK